MENVSEREEKRLAFVEERMKIREQEKKQLDAEKSKWQQVKDKTKLSCNTPTDAAPQFL